MRRELFRVVAMVALLAGMAGCSVDTEPLTALATTSTKLEYQAGPSVGATLEVKYDRSVVAVTVAELRPVLSSRALTTPDGQYVEVTVTLLGIQGTFHADPSSFAARTAAGVQMRAELGATTDQLAAVAVQAGETISGTVAFDVPAGQRIELVAMGNGLGEMLATWRTDPDRSSAISDLAAQPSRTQPPTTTSAPTSEPAPTSATRAAKGALCDAAVDEVTTATDGTELICSGTDGDASNRWVESTTPSAPAPPQLGLTCPGAQAGIVIGSDGWLLKCADSPAEEDPTEEDPTEEDWTWQPAL